MSGLVVVIATSHLVRRTAPATRKIKVSGKGEGVRVLITHPNRTWTAVNGVEEYTSVVKIKRTPARTHAHAHTRTHTHTLSLSRSLTLSLSLLFLSLSLSL